MKSVDGVTSKLAEATLDGASDEESASEDTSGSSSQQSDDSESSESESSEAEELRRHLKYLKRSPVEDNRNEAALSPIFTSAVRRYARDLEKADGRAHKPLFPQHALLGCEADAEPDVVDSRLYYNVAAPCSIFVCGSQGSGKSHTLSCILENCLIQSDVSELCRPLTGLVFHYDTFISEAGGAPCEAAYLASNPKATVRVLCAPTNLGVITKTYQNIPRVKVEPLEINESDLNTKRMLDLMAVGEGSMPLYLHVIQRILREMRIDQQRGGQIRPFNYAQFKERILKEDLTPMQMTPLNQRLDTLESFMVKKPAGIRSAFSRQGTNWEPVAGQLTIVDLSCPCVTAEMACSLFNICLSIFLEKGGKNNLSSGPSIGRIVALDEAHKYMTTDETGAAAALTNNLLATIRLQRHLGLRVVISTQEPTVSPKLLDLCSITIVHRFTSPDWMRTLRGHLAGGDDTLQQEVPSKVSGTAMQNHFASIVKLRVGEALMFAPSAAMGLEGKEGATANLSVKRLGHEALKIRVRNRITADGGRSLLAL